MLVLHGDPLTPAICRMALFAAIPKLTNMYVCVTGNTCWLSFREHQASVTRYTRSTYVAASQRKQRRVMRKRKGGEEGRPAGHRVAHVAIHQHLPMRIGHIGVNQCGQRMANCP